MRSLLRAGIAVLALTPAPARAQGENVLPLPRPTGRFAVGTVVDYLTDASRRDGDFPDGRPITVQLWYPAAAPGDSTAPYLVEPALGAALLRYRYYGVDSAALLRWDSLPTHAWAGVEPAADRHPVLLFSVGLGVIRANYTSIAEALASRGYIVALAESPLQGLMATGDGAVVTDTSRRFGEPAAHRAGVAAWASDLSYVLDRLLAGEVSPDVAKVAATIDSSRVGAMGHSTGGLVAVTACEGDPRIRACVNLDGGLADPAGAPLAEFVESGVTRPTLFLRSEPLYDDTTLARRGMTRDEWEHRGESGRRALEALRRRSRGPLSLARVAGTGHFSFSDAPFVMPSAISRFGGRIIEAERGLEVIISTLQAFFGFELDRRGERLSDLPARIPELTVEPARLLLDRPVRRR